MPSTIFSRQATSSPGLLDLPLLSTWHCRQLATTDSLTGSLNRRSFMAGIAEFRTAIGEDNVFVEEERLAPYTKIMIPGEDADHAPSAAIAPASVAQVQAILAICNRRKIPVWPVSTGKNFGYGTAAPAMRGTVVLDLRRMNRIIEVDGEWHGHGDQPERDVVRDAIMNREGFTVMRITARDVL